MEEMGLGRFAPFATPVSFSCAAAELQRGRRLACFSTLSVILLTASEKSATLSQVLVRAPIYARLIPFTNQTEAAWYMRREGPRILIGRGAVESDEEVQR